MGAPNLQPEHEVRRAGTSNRKMLTDQKLQTGPTFKGLSGEVRRRVVEAGENSAHRLLFSHEGFTEKCSIIVAVGVVKLSSQADAQTTAAVGGGISRHLVAPQLSNDPTPRNEQGGTIPLGLSGSASTQCITTTAEDEGTVHVSSEALRTSSPQIKIHPRRLCKLSDAGREERILPKPYRAFLRRRRFQP